MSNYDEIESLLARLLNAAAPAMSDAEQAEVQRFVEVGEYGLALETAVAIYSEEHKRATTEVVTGAPLVSLDDAVTRACRAIS